MAPWLRAAEQDVSQLMLLYPLSESGDGGNRILAAEPAHPNDRGVAVDEVGLSSPRATLHCQHNAGAAGVGLGVRQDRALVGSQVRSHCIR